VHTVSLSVIDNLPYQTFHYCIFFFLAVGIQSHTMPLLHLQLRAPTNDDGTAKVSNNPTFRIEMGHEYFTQPITLRTVSITSYDTEDLTSLPPRLYTQTRSDNTMFIDMLSDQQLNSRQVNTNVNDASSFPIPCDYSTKRDACQQYTSLDYTFNLHHIEPGNSMNIRVLGSDSSVNNWTRWSSDFTQDDAIYQIDLTFEYEDISGVI